MTIKKDKGKFACSSQKQKKITVKEIVKGMEKSDDIDSTSLPKCFATRMRRINIDWNKVVNE